MTSHSQSNLEISKCLCLLASASLALFEDHLVHLSHLDVCRGSELGPVLPVILVKWIFNGLDCRQTDREMVRLAETGRQAPAWFLMKLQVLLDVGTGIVLDEAAVQISKLVSADVPGWVIGGLEVQIVLPAAVELRGRYVHSDDDLVGVPSLFNGHLQQLQRYTKGTESSSLSYLSYYYIVTAVQANVYLAFGSGPPPNETPSGECSHLR